MLFRILYILFLVSVNALGSQHVGPITFRQLFAVVMLVMCYRETKRLWMDRSFNFLLGFAFFFGLTSLLYGYETEFAKFFIGYYIVAWIAMWSTVIICQKGNSMDCINTLMAVGLFDAVITILQSFGNLFALSIGMVFAPDEVEIFSDRVTEGDIAAISIMGIFGAVYNGYYLLMASVLSQIYVLRYKSVIRILPFAICFVASFLCQQRFPFYVNVCFFGYFLFKYFNHLNFLHKLLFLVIVIIASVYLVPLFVDFSEQNGMRYSSIGTDGTGREEIYEHAEEYISSNLLTANIFDFRKNCGYSPHNLLYNMIIYGGFFGFIFVLISLFIQIKHSIFIIIKPLYSVNLTSFFSACSLLAYNANSLTHNVSIVTGDAIIWILWGVVYSSIAEVNTLLIKK